MKRLLAVLLALAPLAAAAQDVPPAGAPPSPAPAPVAAAPDEDDDVSFDAAEPDVSVVTVPTTFRLPEHAWMLRVTHRFTRPLGDGDLGDLVGDLFGLDSGAQVGLELRFGLTGRTQLGAHRTSDRNIQLFAQHVLMPARSYRPHALGVLLSVDGADNFSEHHSPALGVIGTRRLGTRSAVHVVPMVVFNTLQDDFSAREGEEDTAVLVGLGARIGVTGDLSFLAEAVPRLGGADGHRQPVAFAVEKRVGGHGFQVTVSNFFGTTPRQVAEGAIPPPTRGWFLGFAISRKFY